MAQKSILSFFKAPASNTQKAAKSTISCSSKRKNSTDEEKLQKSPVKVQDKQVEQKSDAEINQPELNKTNCQKSDIDAEKNEKKVEVIPRRNTARKQMRSISKLKKEVNTKSKPKNSPKTTKNNIKTENLPNEPEIKETDGIEENLGVSENGICDSVKQERNDSYSIEQKIGNNSVSTEKLETDESSENKGKTLDDINNNTDGIKKGKKRKKNVISDDSPVKNSKETANQNKEKISVPTDDSEINELSGDKKEIIDDVSNEENEITKKVKKRKKNVILDDSPVKISEGNADREINANDESKTDIKKESHCVENKKQKIEDLAVTDDSKMDHSGANQEINDEIIQKVKKRKKNIITDDSPVKSNKTDSDLCNLPNKTENEVDANAESKANEKKEVKSSTEKKAVHSFFAPKKTSTVKQSNSNVVADDKSKKAAKNISLPSTKDKEIYNPAKTHYHPIDDACWKRGEKVPYLALARTLEEVENISARLKMIEILANYFRSVITLTPEDLLHSVYLCLNRIAPEYEGIEMSVGESLLMKAVAQATGRTMEKIKAEVAIKGDLGLVAESSRGNQRVMFAPPKLTVSSVFSKFKEIAMMSGNAVMSKKVDKIQALFVACRHCEARYIIRSLTGKLRIGLAEQSVLAALSQAAVLTPPNQSYPPEIMNASSKHSTDSFKKILEANTLILKTTYCECPNYDMLIPILLKEGISGLPEHCHLTPGMPLKPMLAHPTKGIEEVLRRFDTNEFTCEFKYDGERAQIHVMENGEGKIYSRNQEDNTSKYPDVLSRLSKALKPETKSCILDTEVVAWDCESNQILPFQVLSTRKRKDAVESEIIVQVCVVAFDLLYLNGESLIKKPLKERRELLLSSFIEVPNEFKFVQSTDGNSVETMQVFLEESIKGNCEGLMVKSLEVDASYEIAKRSHNWLKLKKDYLDGIGDTLDLVVIGGFHGKGKRTGNYGGFLLACYDDENEEFQTICKIGTGFKEEDLENHTKFFKEHVITEAKSYFRFDNSLEPDEWFEPVQVWEVKCADLSISPVHKAALGIVDSEKGISLRFPRFLRIREDKKTEEATTASQVAQMYNSQEQVQNQKQKDGKIDDEDFY